MIQPIMKDPLFLSMKSEPATRDDMQVGQDLLDTLKENRNGCVGMAANMIGVRKRIIVLDHEGQYILMYNPEILKKSEPYEAMEGCLSLTGMRKAKRFKSIKVSWLNENFQPRVKNFTGWSAQIIQHEIDHCDGILI